MGHAALMDLNNPNHIEGNDDSSGVTVTPLERTCDAWAATIVAATYPSDTNARFVAIKNCETIGVMYIDAVARRVEALDLPMDRAMNQARFDVADELGALVKQMRAQGGEPREGILSNGRQADAQGFEDPDDYGSLA